MELHLKITGWLLILISMVHIIFPKKFEWAKELSGLSLINRQVMHIHTFFIALTVLLMGILCCSSSKELLETGLGKKLDMGLWIFWTIRLIVQFFWFSSELWKGKRTETAVHIVFSFLWVYISAVFFVAYSMNRSF